MKIKVLSILLMFVSIVAYSQDNSFSTISNTVLYLNPACVGVFNQDVRLSTIYRSQGRANDFPSSNSRPYTTYGVQSDFAIYFNKEKTDFFGLGINAFQHNEGFLGYKQTNATMAFSYTKGLSANVNDFISIGFQGGIFQRAMNLNNLTWDSQFDGTYHKGSITEYYDTRNLNYYDFGSGLFYNKKISNSIRLNAGASIFHFFEPKVSMNSKYYGPDENSYKINRKYTFHGTAEIYTSRNSQTIIVPAFIYSVHNAQKNAIIGIDLKYLLGSESKLTDFIRQNSISFGISYRNLDALIPHIKMDYQLMSFYIAYDYTVSKLNSVNKGFGAYEFGLTWKLKSKITANNKPRVYKFIQ